MQSLLTQLANGEPLETEQAIEAFEWIMTGRAEPAQTGALLAFMQARGPTVEEVVGAATVMRRKIEPVEPPAGVTVLDTCGTGGTGSHLFNISTAAAIVTASVVRDGGFAVAKHGNRSITSCSGSAEVFQSLGVTLTVDPPTLRRCLEEAGLCFCFAPHHHPAMRHAAPVRRALGFRTLFNLLGPLTNPARASRQLIGVSSERMLDFFAEVLKRLETERALLVHATGPGGESVCELTTFGTTRAVEMHQGRARRLDIDPADLDLPFAVPDAVTVSNSDQSASMIRLVLEGRHGPARDITALNTAAALRVAGVCEDWGEGLERAARAIDAGDALRVLDTLVRLTRESG